MPKGRPRDPSRANHWRIAASRIGVPLEEYTRQRLAGNRWCYACRRFRAQARFGPDKLRPGGVDGTCIECRKLLDDSRGDRHGRKRDELELEEASHGICHAD